MLSKSEYFSVFVYGEIGGIILTYQVKRSAEILSESLCLLDLKLFVIIGLIVPENKY